MEKSNGKRWWGNGPLGCARGPGAFQEGAYPTCWGSFDWKKPMENDGGVTGPLDAPGGQAHSRGALTPLAGAALIAKNQWKTIVG